MMTLWSLALGIVAGLAAYYLGLPLPWMLGPMMAATTAASFGMQIKQPKSWPLVALPIIGVMLGSRITAEIFEQAGQFTLTLVLLVPFGAAACGVSFLFYRKFAGFDRVTAYYASMPGGLNDMMILGAAAGGDERRIGLAHAARVLCVIGFVALFFGFVLGVRSANATREWIGLTDLGVTQTVWMLGSVAVGIPLGKALRLPAAQMLGPMLVSGAVHIAGLVELPPPNILVIGAQIVLGVRIGTRFSGVPMRLILRDLGYGAVSSVLMIGVALAFAYLASELSGVAMTQSFLAFSPGGFIEMGLLALALGQEVAYVSFAHVVRILLVIFGAPLVFHALWGKSE